MCCVLKQKPRIESLEEDNDEEEGQLVPVTLKLKNFIADPHCEALVVVGSNKVLGEWELARAPRAKNVREVDWVVKTKFPANMVVEWRWVCVNKRSGQVLKSEMAGNRRVYVGDEGFTVTCQWGEKEKFKALKRFDGIKQSSTPAEGKEVELRTDEKPHKIQESSTDESETGDSSSLTSSDSLSGEEPVKGRRSWLRTALIIAIPVGLAIGTMVAYTYYNTGKFSAQVITDR